MSHFDKHIVPAELATMLAHITEQKGELLRESGISHNEITLQCRRTRLLELLRFLRDDKTCLFKMLVDVCGADYPERDQRFEVVYHLLSTLRNFRIRIKVQVEEGGSVPSVTDLFSSANWYEREVFDMFGVNFENHPDMRRILTDYNFSGHPLRKDFPVEGETEVYFDEQHHEVRYKPIDLPQDFRDFKHVSPWKNADNALKMSESYVAPKAEVSDE